MEVVTREVGIACYRARNVCEYNQYEACASWWGYNASDDGAAW